MARKASGRRTLRLIRGSLQLLFAISVVETTLTFYLYSRHWVDSTMLPSEILITHSAVITMIHVLLHSYLGRRYYESQYGDVPRTTISSFCSHLPRFTVLLWMISSAFGLVPAARQPQCLPGEAMQNFWQIGKSCQFHRVTVGLAVLAFVASCTLFCSIQISPKPFKAGIFHIYARRAPFSSGLGSSTSGNSSNCTSSNTSSTSSPTPEKYIARQPTRSVTDLEPSCSEIPRPPSSVYATSSFRHSSPSARLGAAQGLYRPLTSHSTYYGPFRSPLTMSTFSNVTSSSMVTTSSTSTPKRSPLSTMRLASEPDVPLIPDRFKQTPSMISAPAPPSRSTTKDSFLPMVKVPSLTADVEIRALSGSLLDSQATNTTCSPEKPKPAVLKKENLMLNRPRPRADAGSISPPPRAPGHTYYPCMSAPDLTYSRPPRTPPYYADSPVTRPSLPPSIPPRRLRTMRTPSTSPSASSTTPRRPSHRRSNQSYIETRQSTVPQQHPLPRVPSEHAYTRSSSTEIEFTIKNVVEARRIKDRTEKAIERKRRESSMTIAGKDDQKRSFEDIPLDRQIGSGTGIWKKLNAGIGLGLGMARKGVGSVKSQKGSVSSIGSIGSLGRRDRRVKERKEELFLD